MAREQNNPCFNCPDRHAGCHGTCERYKAWSVEHAEQREAYREKKSAFMRDEAYHVETSKRLNSRKKRGHGGSKR